MDRLQQAISKARNQRGATTETAPKAADSSPRPTPEHSPVVRNRPGPRVLNDVDANWGQLEPLLITSRTTSRNVLVAHTAGENAIPFDMLRTKVLQQARKNNWKRIAIVSPESGAGKTTVCANLGLSFSRMRDKRTVILDFDLRRVGLGRILGQKSKHSMSDVLEGRIDFGQHGLCYEGNVAFGLNRERVVNPSELLQSPKTGQVLDEIEAAYEPEIMLFDTAPMMVSDDSQGFLQSVDCALLVVAAEKTPMDRIDVAERQLSELTNVMGIILNRCRYTSGAHGYENQYY